MRAVIIGNGDIDDYSYICSKLREGDFIICADGGLNHIQKLGIKADIAIGDFDSAEPCGDVECIRYPRDKDFTDGELAVLYAVERDFDEILLVAMTSGRLDHTITNIMLLTKDSRLCLLDEKNEIFAVKDSIKICKKRGKTLSIIPVFSDLEGISTTGLLYPLHNGRLEFAKGRGNSNVITDDICTISVTDGIGVVIITDGE